MKRLLTLLSLLLAPFAAGAETAVAGADGQVTLPLTAYTGMLESLAAKPGRAPASYAIGQSEVVVRVLKRDGGYTASVAVTLRIETFEDQWTLVPILPAGTVLRRASANGRPAQLVRGPDGLAWSTETAGVTTFALDYGVDARRFDAGFVLPLPVPRAASTTLTLEFPARGVDLAVVPALDLQSVAAEQGTRYSAAIPATSSILVSWRGPGERAPTVGRAHYQGTLEGDAVAWTASFEVELFSAEAVTLPLMPTGVTLKSMTVDGAPATVLEQAGRFATLVRGRGMHEVVVAFEVPVVDDDGPPRVHLPIPRVPVSRFELRLPGKKTVKVGPGANVTVREAGEATLASAHIAMSDGVVFTWTDAIPEDLRPPFRANASLYHAVHAEEGVLHGRAAVVYEITHGESGQFVLSVPAEAQINRITAPGGGLSEWAVGEIDESGDKTINVFLEAPVKGEFVLDIAYERLLGAAGGTEEGFGVPLLSAQGVHRQRGMVALLSGRELALKPLEEAGVARVGENQLPAFFRNQISMTVAHTYKYIERRPTLTVATVTPERRQGKFDAQVDTLISLGDVAMKGSATIEIDVKSGAIMALDLGLPGDVNILGVSGPSLRSQRIEEVESAQVIRLAFTREMEGRFRIEVNYERIMDASGAGPLVPTVSVAAAEVEHGRIAVEALAAVEVRAGRALGLSSLDINELPRHLVLKTTNPILLAYRYIQTKSPFELVLAITRHKEIEVQVAAIESARYATLFTRDGLAVTTARLRVRNSRRQFLRLSLPPGSKVWSVFVDGKPEKPAFAGDSADEDGAEVLVKLITSAQGFPVDLVYATPVERIGLLGSLSSRLPRPDMVVTHSRWDVYLPKGPRYQSPDSSLDVLREGVPANPRRAAAFAPAKGAARARMGQPLRISVPTRGLLFAFEKLYADQSPEAAAFTIRYASEDADWVAILLSMIGAALVWLAIVSIGGGRPRLSREQIVGVIAAGVGLLVLAIGYLGTTPIPASAVVLAVALWLGVVWSAARAKAWRARRLAARDLVETV